MGSEGLGLDFLEHLNQADTTAAVFTLLDDPADLARASAVSRSWRRFIIENHLSKIQCLRVCPDASSFVRTQVSSSGDEDGDDTGPSAPDEWENQERDHMVYMHLSHALVSPYASKSCIGYCIGASSTDDFPFESMENTLEPDDVVRLNPSYWSSRGQRDPNVPECLIYRLHSDLCLVDEIKIKVFKAYFQPGHPIYSPKYARFRMGYPKSPLVPEKLVSHQNEGELTADVNYIWTYTSPVFPVLQLSAAVRTEHRNGGRGEVGFVAGEPRRGGRKENVLQSFNLPRPVLCIGGVVKIELLGRIQKQAIDDLYYICVSHVQIQGNPLSRELGVAPCENGVVLRYYSGQSGDNFGMARRRGLRQALLKWMLGPASHFVDEDHQP